MRSSKWSKSSSTRLLRAWQKVGGSNCSGFGAFSTRDRDARTGRNPRSGESVKVPSKRVPYFKPGKEIRERLNK